MFVHFLKSAVRRFAKQKGISAVNILGLSIGSAFCLLVFLYVQDEIGYDRFQKNRDSIFRIDTVLKPGELIAMTQAALGPAVEEQVPEVKASVRNHLARNSVLRADGRLFTEEILFADPSFFDVFTFPVLHGNPAAMLSDRRSILLSRETAVRYFGKENAVGERIEIQRNNAFEEYTVMSVVRDVPRRSSIRFNMVIPFANLEDLWGKDNLNNWWDFSIATYVLLRDGAKPGQIQTTINSVAGSRMGGGEPGPDKPSFRLESFGRIHLNNRIDCATENGIGDVSNPIFGAILSVIGILVLIIAAINFSNFSLAQASTRSKEVAIRKTIGASRIQLVRQFMVDALLMSSVGWIGGVALAEWALPAFNTLMKKHLSLSDPGILPLFAGCVSLITLTSLLVGSYPAWVLSGFQPIKALHGKVKLGGKSRFSKSMVVFQFATAQFLVLVALFIQRQFGYMTRTDLGYDGSGLIRIETFQEDGRRLAESFRNELAPYPDILQVSTDSRYANMSIINRGKQDELQVVHNRIDERYLETMRIPLKKGRNFSIDFPTDERESVLVNEALVRQAGIQEPVGQTLDYVNGGLKNPRIIGVVKDYHYKSLHEKIMPLILHMDGVFSTRSLLVKVRTDRFKQSIALLERTWKTRVPHLPFQYTSAEGANLEQYESEAHWERIVAAGAVFSLLLSVLGLFSISALTVQQRVKEIGIRKVLGASIFDILHRLAGRFTLLVFIAAAVSVPSAYFCVSTWLKNYPYRISVGPLLFVVVCLASVLVSWITIAGQSMKAAGTNPTEALRSE